MKRQRKAYIFSAIIFIVQILLLTGFLSMETNRIKQRNILEASQNYVIFFDEFQDFLLRHKSLMEGISAYIKTFDDYNVKDMNTYLSYLTANNREYIKNIEIIKGRDIIICYPDLEMTNAIGIDLLTVKDQKSIRFYGPVDLLEGELGYIIRMPIEKDNTYWGMINIVLKFDKLNDFLNRLSNEHRIKVTIVESSNGNVIYGNKKIIDKKPLVFRKNYSDVNWFIYVLPEKCFKIGYLGHLIVIAILGLLIIFGVSRKIYTSYSKLEKTVKLDFLTNIYNRSYFESKIIEEFELAKTNNKPLSIVFFDLDDFKTINDSFGHLIGDEILIGTVRKVKALIRDDDVFARWGGDEFVIVMPCLDLFQAEKFAEKLRKAIENMDHPVAKDITASFGVAEYKANEYVEEFLERADMALYASKLNGRNCVTAKKT